MSKRFEGGMDSFGVVSWHIAQYLEAMGLPAGSAQLFTAHQMCSCRMADSPSQVRCFSPPTAEIEATER